MNTRTSAIVAGLSLALSTALTTRAEPPLTLTVSATASVQQETTEVGDAYSTPTPHAEKVDTKAILQQLSEDLGQTFPVGAKLVLFPDAGDIRVVDKTGVEVADVSSIIRFESDDTEDSVDSGKGNHATGARAITSRFLGTLVFDDTGIGGGIYLRLRGLVTATSSATAVDSQGKQKLTVKGALKSGTGTGNAYGDNFVVTGTLNASGTEVIQN